MEMVRVYLMMTTLVVVLMALLQFPSAHAQVPAPAPAPSSDGAAIDQGIAYVLMMLALALTYIIH
ncbi:hypothetical protein LguiA_005154 [Lonicera macranthoides]